MKFEFKKVRTVRKVFQWSAVPTALLAVLTLSHPLLPLLLCFTSLVTLLAAVRAGVVEEQIDASGSSWLWRKAIALPRRETRTVCLAGEEGTYRSPPRPEEPARVVARRLHWFTRVVVMLPVWMGGGGLGWPLVTRAIRQETMRTVRRVMDRVWRWVEEWEAIRFVRSTHVGCSGASCEHCKSIGMMSGEELQELVARDVTEADIERIMPPWLKRGK